MQKTGITLLIILVTLVLTQLACDYATSPTQEELQAEPTKPQDQGTAITPAEGHDLFLPDIRYNAAPEGATEPYVTLQASQEQVRVGESLTVTGWPVQIGLPIYYLVVRDEGVQDAPAMVSIDQDGNFQPLTGSSNILSFVAAEATAERGVFTLRADAVGVTTVEISVTGEVHSAEGASWEGIGAAAVSITVTE